MEDDRSFYQRRLAEELALAAAQTDEGLSALHRRWACLYRERLAALGPTRRPARPLGSHAERLAERLSDAPPRVLLP
ncbi:hypothetical protein ACFOD9_14330 [Novosphingobium bradum]|uniref:Uncharacterized protein n=1 Tax=Novosphingobium bradum TaxID=1737444 RepID=A0ABV7ITZ2_9SPHN